MPKLILTPGLVSDHHIWQHIVAPLAAHNPIIADVSGTTSIAQIASKILAENEGQLMLAGHSMGGIIAVEIYRQASQRIDKLALLNSSMLPQMDGEAKYRKDMVAQVNENGIEFLAQEWLPRLVHKSRRNDTAFMSQISASIMSATPKQHQDQNTALLNRPDGYATIPKITCPTLILAGQDDKLCRAAENTQMANQINGSQLVIIEDCAHFSPLEHPQIVTDALITWLTSSN